MVRSLALVQVLRCSTSVRNGGDCWVLINQLREVRVSMCVETRRMVRSLALVQVLKCSTSVHNGGDCWVLICNQLEFE